MYTEKLAKLLFFVAIAALALVALYFFGTVVGYILLAFVAALIAKPIVRVLRKVKIKGKSAPDALLALLALSVVIAVLFGIFAVLAPTVRNVIANIVEISAEADIDELSAYLEGMNSSLISTFKLAPDFKLEVLAMEQLSSIFSFDMFGNVIGSVASTFVGIGVCFFSVIFIAFYFIKDQGLFLRILTALAPEKYSSRVKDAYNDITHLLSRYFVGLMIEVGIVGMIDFLGLCFVVKIDLQTALGIGFMIGILNVIPYLGPLIGAVIGTLMGVLLKFCGDGAVVDPSMDFWLVVVLLVSVFCFAQLVDNFVLQPLIYSTSIKVTALEIFIVMLLAGSIGGILGMILAIPAYTVLRVIAYYFFHDVRFVRELTGE